MSIFLEDESELATAPAGPKKLFKLGLGGLIAAVVFTIWKSPVEDPLLLFIGLAILALGCLPALQWARHEHPWFPSFEIGALTTVVFYAIPLLSGSEEINLYTEQTLENAGLMILAGLGGAVIAFNIPKSPRTAPAWASAPLLPDDIRRYLPAGLLINLTYLCINRFTDLIPFSIQGSVRALCFGLGIITAFIFAREWGLGRLSRNQKLFFSAGIVVQVIVMFSHLYLINGVSILVLAAIGYTTARRKLPWVPMLVCLPLVAILHSGKSEMRKHYWNDEARMPPAAELPAFFSQWIELGLEKKPDEADSSLTARLAERASLFQMVCLAVDQVPSLRPHLNGESYIDIPAQVVPRFLWANKPSSLMSNVRLAIYFGLIDPDNPYSTSIAFGVIAEAYVNFGIWGVLALGMIAGWAFKQIALRSANAPLFSAIGIFTILLTAWSFQAEQVMATWLASLFQASAVSIGIPLVWRKITGAA